MIVTFATKQRQLAEAITTTIGGEPVEVVVEYRYLGTIFDSLLRFSSNTEEILKKCHQGQYQDGGMHRSNGSWLPATVLFIYPCVAVCVCM